MKVLFVSSISDFVNVFLIPHIELLVKQGHQVDVAFNIEQEVHQDLISLGCKIHNIEFQRSPLNYKNVVAYKNIKKLIEKEKYDLIHVHTPIPSFLTRLACKNNPKLKVLYTAHGFHFYKGAPLRNWVLYYPMEKIVARYTDAIITLNEEDYQSAKGFKLKNRNSVYNTHGVGINLRRFSIVDKNKKRELREKYGYKDSDFILFYAAELNRNKNQDMLINAISLLKNSIPNILLLLAGEGCLKNNYEERVKKLGLMENVKFLGYRKDIHQLLNIADIAVASSRREGLPVNIMEAMASGLPLIVTDCRGHRDLVVNKNNGYLVNVDDYRGLSNRILKIYKSEDVQKRFSKKNLEQIKLYSIRNTIEELRGIYQMFLK